MAKRVYHEEPAGGWQSPHFLPGSSLFERSGAGGWDVGVTFGGPGGGGGGGGGSGTGTGAGTGTGTGATGVAGTPAGAPWAYPGTGLGTEAGVEGALGAGGGGGLFGGGGMSGVQAAKLGLGVAGGFGGGNPFGGVGGGMGKMARAPFESQMIQNFLPPSLRHANVGAFLNEGVQGIGELIRNPGGLSPRVADAIRARLAGESDLIAQNYRGIGQQQAGTLARSNAPLSIRTALESALNTAQERAQRGARRDAQTESEMLRREDLGRTNEILNALLEFTTAGRNQAVGAASKQAGLDQQQNAAQLAFLGNMLSGIGIGGGGGGAGASAASQAVY